MASDKISCQVGKTVVIDPNDFNGHNFGDNVPVSQEDLNIYVQLDVFKKGRTVLTAQKDGVNTAESSRTLTVKFIEGDKVSGEHVLTTSYTDLTTIFDDGSKTNGSSESLGISNIDIDFNSSYAPMVTINFIDVRGGAIYQNENRILNNKNKYATFFQLPYPIYELTVKGYYGKAVKYCLHMTKYTSKFNSQTGNFEITVNFVGYTYAMLSDMLLGFLQVIPYTSIGREVYEEINTELLSLNLPKISTLNELMINISTINQSIEKLSANDEDSEIIKTSIEKNRLLNDVETTITILGRELDIKFNDLSIYNYIVVEGTPEDVTQAGTTIGTTIQEQQASTTFVALPSTLNTTQNNNNNDEILKLYSENITQQINDFNDYSGPKLEPISDFTTLKKYIGLTLGELNPDNDFTEAQLETLSPKLGGIEGQKLSDKINNLYDYLTSKKYDNNLTNITIYDMSDLYAKIQEARNEIQSDIESSTVELAKKLKILVADSIGFDPTIRKITEIFTTAVEVLLITLHRVSIAAEKNTDRKKELDKVFTSKENSDIKTNVKYYPWPDYREYKDNSGYVEKYLGAPNVLNNYRLVNELSFIEELHRAFIEAAVDRREAEINLIGSREDWIPINPFDSKVFVNDSPYKRSEFITPNSVYVLILIRAMTFLGYTNSKLENKADIESMAKSEANLIIRDIKDVIVKQALKNTTISDVLAATGEITRDVIGTVNTPVLTETSGNFTYNYIFHSTTDLTGLKVLPISEKFNGAWNEAITNTGTNIIPNLVDTADKGVVFLTNYSSEVFDSNGSVISKPYDGGQYVKILSKSNYDSSIATLPEDINTKSTLLLDSIKKFKFSDVTKAGFNVFGGIYGIQEFKDLDYGNQDGLVGLPLRFVFYEDDKIRGLGYGRTTSGPNEKQNTTTSIYDFKNTANNVSTVPSDRDVITNTIRPLVSSNKALHKDYGKTRTIFNQFLGYKNRKITYPFVNIGIDDSEITPVVGRPEDNLLPFSLFGTKWYYGQDKSQYRDYSQALLFLSSLPWNGDGFEKYEILHLFNIRGGFIHAPLLWCAYIGGLFWRADETEPNFLGGNIVGGGSGSEDPIIWSSGTGTNIILPPGFEPASAPPSRTNHFNILKITRHLPRHKKFSSLLTGLPDQIKNEFKRIFFEFVNGESNVKWKKISSELVIWGGTSDGFVNLMNTINNISSATSTTSIFRVNNVLYLNSDVIINNFVNYENYKIITPVINTVSTRFNGNMFLELDGDFSDTNSAHIRTLIDAMTEEVVIANANYNVWDTNSNQNDKYKAVSVSKESLNTYLNAMIEVFDNVEPSDEDKEEEQEIFGTTDDNIIRLQLYRTCKNIYDKWIGGVTNEDNIIFQCGNNIRNDLDRKIANKKRGSGAKTRLIDSFRFVNRSFKDIGDDLFINPLPINDFLINSPNSSFYDVVTTILSVNNLDFIALPSYINYNKPEVVSSIFNTTQYKDTLSEGIAGPSFVCVYIGQKSKHLDFNDSEYTNDGFDVKCLNGGVEQNIPNDFAIASDEHENNVAVFSVNYSQQNQNIFKDITLDQSEFGETAESLQIIDDISKNGSENNRTLAGQNLYNVYAIRSYKSEVEMMGNVMIQPMMYYQLNNIPMFHGAYMITHVKHNIKPNYMSTHFTGVRIRSVETPLITAIDMYQSLLSSLNISFSSGGVSSSNIINDPLFNKNIIPDRSLLNENNGFANPFTSSGIGQNSTPGGRDRNGNIERHQGIDFNLPNDSQLQSIADGEIELVKYDFNGSRGFGLYMVINHSVLGDDKKVYKSVYGHLSNIDDSILNNLGLDVANISNLTPEDVNKIRNGITKTITVSKGQKIGKSGGKVNEKFLGSEKKFDLAGGSSGPHLHFELRIGEASDLNTFYKNIPYVDATPYLPLNGQQPTFTSANNNNKGKSNNTTTTTTPNEKDRLALLSKK
jgi:hypothetical protein